MLQDLLTKETLTKDDIITLLKLTDPQDLGQLYAAAYATKVAHVGNVSYYRGLMEFGNDCIKDCHYCGIRKSNNEVERFTTSLPDIAEMATWAYENHYGSVTLQSGELQNPTFTQFVSDAIGIIKKIGGGKLGLTLCVGEQTEAVYKQWFDQGAHRYLLRIETTNPSLYAKIHPNDALHSLQNRNNCIRLLQKVGFQTGTGVMIGLPDQTEEDLANDLLFFKDMNIDMIGMGPYVVHQNTPLGQVAIARGLDTDECKEQRFILGLKMIAVTRLFLKDVNIASTTALETLHPSGRELGLAAGANILMPLITNTDNRPKYQLYDNKPFLDSSPTQLKDNLAQKVASIGDTVGFDSWGDSPHYKNTQAQK